MLAGQTVETKWSFLLRDTARGIYYFIYNGFALIPKMGSSCAAHAYQGGNSKTVSHYSRITQITQTIQTQEVGIVKETMIASNSPILLLIVLFGLFKNQHLGGRLQTTEN